MTDEQAEIAQLKKELREAEIEREILKKAISIFSRKDGKPTNL
jgi:transposase